MSVDSLVIPPLTSPLANHWRQPHSDEILISKDGATMSQKAFDMLANYSSSNPSGIYEGKMWKCQDEGTWFLCWYWSPTPNADFCYRTSREITIMDWKAMMGIQNS